MKKSLSIEIRTIGAFCLLSLLTAATCMAAYYYLLGRDFRERMSHEFEATALFQDIALRQQRDRAGLIAANLAADSDVREAALARNAYKIDELLKARAATVDADFIAVAGADGVIVSQIEPGPGGKRIVHGDPVFLDALFARAAGGEDTAGLALCRPDVICMNAYSRIRWGGNTVGFVRVGFALDDGFAEEMRNITGTEFVLVREGRAIASSMSGRRLSTDEVGKLSGAMRRQGARHGVAATVRMKLRGSAYALRGAPLKDVSGRELGWLFAARDTAELAAAWKRALRALLAIAAVAIAVSVAIGFAVSRPQAGRLKMLLRRVREITQGDLHGSINVRHSDEIGRLAAAFNEMSASLTERDRRLRENAEELRRNQEQIIQSGKLAAIGELAAGVAHEIGNPLSAISGYAQILQKGGRTPEVIKEYSAEIEREAGYIERIIEDLLDFARPSAEGPVLLDLNEIAESALKTASAHKAFGKVEVKKNYSTGTVGVFANRKELVQVCINLFMNAAQAMPDGGALEITTAAGRGMVSLTVTDSGKGVPDTVRDKIFDPFFTTKPPGVGTGLGLSICYRIVEKYRGALTFHNRSGGGAAFTVTLPAAEKSGGPAPEVS